MKNTKVKSTKEKKIVRKKIFSPVTDKVALTKELLIEGMKNLDCFISSACAFAGCSRNTFQRYYRDDEEFRDKIDELNEAKIDEMERRLERKIKDDTVAAIFWLKCKGRKRGWNERVTIDIAPESKLIPNEILDNAVDIAVKTELDRRKAELKENNTDASNEE